MAQERTVRTAHRPKNQITTYGTEVSIGHPIQYKDRALHSQVSMHRSMPASTSVDSFGRVLTRKAFSLTKEHPNRCYDRTPEVRQDFTHRVFLEFSINLKLMKGWPPNESTKKGVEMLSFVNCEVPRR